MAVDIRRGVVDRSVRADRRRAAPATRRSASWSTAARSTPSSTSGCARAGPARRPGEVADVISTQQLAAAISGRDGDRCGSSSRCPRPRCTRRAARRHCGGARTRCCHAARTPTPGLVLEAEELPARPRRTPTAHQRRHPPPGRPRRSGDLGRARRRSGSARSCRTSPATTRPSRSSTSTTPSGAIVHAADPRARRDDERRRCAASVTWRRTARLVGGPARTGADRPRRLRAAMLAALGCAARARRPRRLPSASVVASTHPPWRRAASNRSTRRRRA